MMNVENATNLTEGQGRLPSKGSLSIHQKALYLFWLSVLSLAVFRKLLFFFKVPAIHTFRLIASGKSVCLSACLLALSSFLCEIISLPSPFVTL